MKNYSSTFYFIPGFLSGIKSNPIVILYQSATTEDTQSNFDQVPQSSTFFRYVLLTQPNPLHIYSVSAHIYIHTHTHTDVLDLFLIRCSFRKS